MTIYPKAMKVASTATRIALAPPIKLVEGIVWPHSEKDAKQPVFIVGAPRTGSTILYQALTNACNLAYIDNTACTWYRNLRFGMWLSYKKYDDTPHSNFQADLGDTRKFGGHAPSECGEFWYRWLPRDRHFIDYNDITPRMVGGLRTEVFGIASYLNKPLLFKNLNAGQRLRLIYRAFPDARIIFIRRDPRFVIRSIQNARRVVGVKSGEWWSIMPPNVRDLLSLPESDMCAAQVYFIEKQIEEDLALFPEKNVKEIHYQNLKASLVDQLGKWLDVNPRLEGGVPEFFEDTIENIASDELEEFERLASHYPFRKELFI